MRARVAKVALWLGIVAAVVGAIVLGFHLREQSRIAAAVAQMKRIERAIAEYQLSLGKPPATLLNLLDRDPAGSPTYPDPNQLRDPWGHEYQYTYDEKRGPIISCTTPSGLTLRRGGEGVPD